MAKKQKSGRWLQGAIAAMKARNHSPRGEALRRRLKPGGDIWMSHTGKGKISAFKKSKAYKGSTMQRLSKRRKK